MGKVLNNYRLSQKNWLFIKKTSLSTLHIFYKKLDFSLELFYYIFQKDAESCLGIINFTPSHLELYSRWLLIIFSLTSSFSIFQVAQIEKMSITIGKSSDSWFRKWYGMLCFDENFLRYEWPKIGKNAKKLLNQQFFHFLEIFHPSSLEKYSSKYIIPYHFLNQLSELFTMALLIFQFEQLEKLVFIAYKGLDHKNNESTCDWRF